MEITERIKIELKKLGINIQKIRKEQNITTEQLSELSGIKKELLEKFENGTAYNVKLNKHILKIAEALNITLYQIFDYNNK